MITYKQLTELQRYQISALKKAGILEGKQRQPSQEGVPQGSPFIAVIIQCYARPFGQRIRATRSQICSLCG